MSGHGSSGSGRDASQQLDATCTALLHLKQAKLDVIKDKHDNLVHLSCLFPHALFCGGCGDSVCAFLLIICGLCSHTRRFILSSG